MQKLFIILTSVFFGQFVISQTTYVPDDNFEQRLIVLGYDDILDDYVQTANIASIYSLFMSGANISDLTGLQDFESLTDLNLSYNQITEINFHPNVNLQFFILNDNPISQLDLSSHTNLSEFSITNTNISNLDLSNNPTLRYLYCANTPLSEIDLSNNPLLIELNCSDTQIQELDLSNNVDLSYLVFRNTQTQELNLFNNPNLNELRLNDGQFERIDLRNGTNQDINFVTFLNNPNLDYILVDDCNYSTNNWTNVDSGTIFIENDGDTSCAPLSINDLDFNNEVSTYPNPNNGIIFLKKSHNINIDKAYLTDLSGKTLKEFTSNFKELDITNLMPGTYLLKIHLKTSRVITKKIIKR